MGTPDSFSLPPPSQSSEIFYCHEYDHEASHTLANEICYTSTFKKTLKKYILTIETDSITLRFGVLRTLPIITRKESDPYNGKGSHHGTQSFAIILGQPDQLYVIREETRIIGFKRYYWFSIIPIRQNPQTPKPEKGHVVEISTEQICKTK
jgi:hypothetical protein